MTCFKTLLLEYSHTSVNPYHAKLIYLILLQLEVVSRCRDPQPQVVKVIRRQLH